MKKKKISLTSNVFITLSTWNKLEQFIESEQKWQWSKNSLFSLVIGEGNQKILSNMQGIRKHAIQRKKYTWETYHLSNGSKLTRERKSTNERLMVFPSLVQGQVHWLMCQGELSFSTSFRFCLTVSVLPSLFS